MTSKLNELEDERKMLTEAERKAIVGNMIPESAAPSSAYQLYNSAVPRLQQMKAAVVIQPAAFFLLMTLIMDKDDVAASQSNVSNSLSN